MSGGQHRPRHGAVTWHELMTHDSIDDLWVSIDGVVYDMTEFVRPDKSRDKDTGMTVMKHPGGQDIPLQFAGKDATQYWNDIHGLHC